MPHALVAADAADIEEPAYFSSLSALAECVSDNLSELPPALPQAQRDQRRRPRGTYVCHDYKGGYYERHDVREYTFHWFHLVDTFIYFSHHRVTCPPRAWIRTAHRHDTRIFGTLIFEWDEGKRDLDRLLGLEDGSTVDLSYADKLVALTRQRGFDGWLVNVEVPLATPTHVQAMLAWLSYFRAQLHQFVPGSELMWYDGVNTTGKVQWQNALTDLNKPFLDVCDTIFLNYHWHPDEPRRFAQSASDDLVDRVVFGVDVYGRGQYGGGRFDTWRALECIERATTSDRRVNFALFAPGWTVESEHLSNELTSSEAYARWWDDERYLCLGGSETSNVAKMRTVVDDERRVARGVQRARDIAKVFAWSAPPLPPFDYNSPLPPLPGNFRPVSSFAHKCKQQAQNHFYTSFSSGCGRGFFIDGQQVFTSERGWTDVDFSFAFPDRAFSLDSSAVRFRFDDSDAWLGARSLRFDFDQMPTAPVDLCSARIACKAGTKMAFTVVWKGASTGLVVNLHSAHPSLRQEQRTQEALSNGWQRSKTIVLVERDCEIDTVSLVLQGSLDDSAKASLLLGAISVEREEDGIVPTITNVRQSGRDVAWDNARVIKPSAMPSAPSFDWYIVQQKQTDREPTFLGTTFSRSFRLPGAAQGMVMIQGVTRAGEVTEGVCNDNKQ